MQVRNNAFEPRCMRRRLGVLVAIFSACAAVACTAEVETARPVVATDDEAIVEAETIPANDVYAYPQAQYHGPAVFYLNGPWHTPPSPPSHDVHGESDASRGRGRGNRSQRRRHGKRGDLRRRSDDSRRRFCRRVPSVVRRVHDDDLVARRGRLHRRCDSSRSRGACANDVDRHQSLQHHREHEPGHQPRLPGGFVSLSRTSQRNARGAATSPPLVAFCSLHAEVARSTGVETRDRIERIAAILVANRREAIAQFLFTNAPRTYVAVQVVAPIALHLGDASRARAKLLAHADISASDFAITT